MEKPSDELRPFSKREERRLLKAGKHFLLTAHPNPGRIGCPGPEILRAIAFRKRDLAHAKPWIDHLGECSPCYREYHELRQQAEKRTRLQILGWAAMLLIAIGIGAWVWMKKLKAPPPYEEAAIDLANRPVLRGEEGGAEWGGSNTPLELARRRLALAISLPVGRQPGDYEVQIIQKAGNFLVSGEGSARLRDHRTVLKVRLDLTRLPSGLYLLTIRRRGFDWNYYPLFLR